jgi:glycolate oxidase iron-sulfur subunit
MQTTFTPEQLKDPAIQRSNEILRTCVHCGFCTATCPTYQVLGDELDSPRGRIYLIKDMLENGRPADEKTVKHIDRCLSLPGLHDDLPLGRALHASRRPCAGIHRADLQAPALRAVLRWTLARILPYPMRFRVALLGAKIGRPFRRADARCAAEGDAGDGAEAIPPVSRNDDPQVFPAKGERKMRVALMTGCAQRALNTDINDATIRLLTRLGCEVVIAEGQGCCGALTHHMGKTAESHATAAKNIRAWHREMRARGSMRSSSTPRAAARRSRITATCSATRRWRRRRRR